MRVRCRWCFFFFSSRRRHTRLQGDWSSDVCSSDLLPLSHRGRAVSALAPLRIGTRASALALWQARHVESLVRAQPGAPPVELVHIRTEGDVQSDVPLWQGEGKAFFTKEIDPAPPAGTLAISGHMLKDLATRLEPGLQLAAT